MLKLRIIALVFYLAAQPLAAQQNNIWYFGHRAALDFNSTSPNPLHNSLMDADEGSASICDADGNLLFYTNGLTVYNKNHQVMLNGAGLAGNKSTFQTIIVPLPGNPNIYYIFTSDAVENNFANGYTYSVVDMSQDGGKGQVVSKNVVFFQECTERITAARHADGVSVWIITNDKNSNTFRAWLMDCNGFSSNPVVSTIGAVLDADIYMNIGMMKVSPDGKQLCQTHFPDDGLSSNNFAQLFDFNSATGVLSNPRSINPGDARMTSCEFSSNSSLLYISRAYDKKIDQYECKLPATAAIIASRFVMNSDVNFFGMQLAPDEKIYLASPATIHLGAINYPNVKGAGCLFRKQQIDIFEGIGGGVMGGLPSSINDLSYDGSHNYNFTILDSCAGTVQFNAFSSIPGGASWSWDFGDGGTSTLQNPTHSFSASSSIYTVKLKILPNSGCGMIERVKKVIPKGILISPAFTYKVVCDSNYVRFTNNSSFSPDTAFIQYSWNFGDNTTSTDLNPIHSYANPGNYTVRLTVQTTTPCLNASLSKSFVVSVLNITASPDQVIDMGQAVQISATGGGTRFQWSPTAGLSNATVANPFAKPRRSTNYIVTAFDENGCKDVDSVFIEVNRLAGIHMPTAFTPNNDGKNDIIRPYVADEYNLNEFAIYNRWGQKIYSTSTKEAGWNGKLGGLSQNAGVYIYIIVATDIVTSKKEEKKGSFVLIR